MATNMNMTRKPNLGLNEFPGAPVVSLGDYMSMGKNVSSPNFPMALSNNQMPHNNERAMMGPTSHNPFSPNVYGQASNSFGVPSRQFENPVELARQKFSPLANSNMASNSPYSGHYVPPNGSESEQFSMNRFPAKYRNQEMFNVNKSLEQESYAQATQRSMTSNPWTAEYTGRNNRRHVPAKGLPLDQQGVVDPNVNQNLNIDQNFTDHGASGAPQQPYPMQSQYMTGDVYKHQSHMNEQQFNSRGVGPNFQTQGFYQQEQMRQMANAQQYQQHTQVPHPGNNFMAPNQRNSPGAFPQSILPKPSQDPMYSQQYSGSPKANGPHPVMNMHNASVADGRQVPFHSPNYPVSPAGSQMPTKPGYPPPLGMRGTFSPNVTIGVPKKPFQQQQQEEGIPSPAGNQNAAAAAAAAAVLAAINTANSHSSPQSTGDLPNVPSRPPSIHTKDQGSRSPATSSGDHKSESGGSGVNDLGAATSPSKSLNQSNAQMSGAQSAKFSSDVATGRVPSPSVNQLPSSDIEAMIHSVSNIPGNGISSSEHSSTTSHRNKKGSKLEPLQKAGTRSTLSPVTPPSPFSLSPSITDLELDILSPSWEDPGVQSTTPVNKLYKLSDEPERKVFLDKLVLFTEQHGKSLGDIPTFNGAALDLYKFYKLVDERGGFHEVIRMTLWKEVVQALTNCGDTSLSDSQLLREQYVRFILPFEAKFKDSTSFSTVSTAPVTKSGTSPSSHPLGNIDLSTMSYKTLSMFQSTANAPTPPFNQAAPNQSSQPPSSYAGTPSTQQPQAYPGTPTMSHLLPSYRNVTQPVPSMPGYCDPPSASPRVPGYPASPSPSLTAPGYPSHQLPGFTGTSSSSQLPGFHNPSLASQVPGYPSPRNAVAQEATYLREQQADFLRGPSHGMNKHYQHMTDSPQQHSTMFSNFSQQSQHPAGMMYPQHPSNISAQYSRRSTGGMASPKQRMQAMQNQWGSKYLQGTTLSDSGLGMGAAGHSQFHPSQSPGHKMAGVRPPPPYPLPKRDKSSPMAHPSTTSSQHQTLKMGVQRSPGRKEEGLFPSGCVESTKPVYSRKRRLTARDLGPVEAWRIMMSLKSGLLSETTWALDTLTILLYDDTTVGFFRLANLPGLLDTIIEHFRRNLINVFGILSDSEVDVGVPKKFIYGQNDEEDEDKTCSETLTQLCRAEENFSAVIAGDYVDEDKGFSSGVYDWAHGGGDTTIHIQTHFETDVGFYEGRVSQNQTEPKNEGNTFESSCENKIKNDIAWVGSTDDHRKESSAEELQKETKCAVKNEVVKHVNGEINKDDEKPRKLSNSSGNVNRVYNGLKSSELRRTKADSVDNESELVLEVSTDKKHRNQIMKCSVKQEIFCNGEDRIVAERSDHDRTEVKFEQASRDLVKDEDPSSALIKRLKADLDLDVDSVSEDVEDVSNAEICKLQSVESSEVECEIKREFPLSTLTWSQDSAIRCCTCVSNIIRSLSFIPGNDVEMARHPSLLLILGKLLLLHHKQKKGRRESVDGQYNDEPCWWHDCLETVREHALVTVANIAGYLDLSLLTDTVSHPLLDGLLHWIVCQSATAVDSLGTTAVTSLSPKHLVLETLAKMSVLESNVDFILMSPDKTRLSKVYEYLVKLFSDKTNEVTREFALVLLSSLTQADEGTASSCSEKNLITVLVGFLEDAKERVEAMAAHGIHPGLFHPDDMRVSMGMLRRAAGLLACIAKRTNSAHLIPYQERILALSMSRLLDIEVHSYLSNVLYNLPR